MEQALESMTLLKAMVETGNPNSVTDAGVGALCARSAVTGAFLNVRVNANSLHDRSFAEKILEAGKEMEEQAELLEKEILLLVDERLTRK